MQDFCNSGFSFNCVLIYSLVFYGKWQVDTYSFCMPELNFYYLNFSVVRAYMAVNSSIFD